MKKQTKLGLVLAAAAVISVSVASLVSARGWVQNGADWYYVDNNNEYVTDTIQSSGNSKFYLGEDGKMERDYFLEDYNENTYYFGQNGAMVTNTWVAIESSRVDNQEDYIPDNYWYYFQASGKAMKGNSSKVKKTTIDGKKYAFNQYGQMLTGWFGEDGIVVNPDDESNPFSNALYYAGGDNDGVLRTGWVTYYDGYEGNDDDPETEYTNLYFYFNTSNNKKYGNTDDGAVTKKINGRTYAFTSEGVMLSGWDPYKAGSAFESINGKTTYFSTEDDGHQVKKGWVYAVPAESIDSKKYNDDEEVYMYFQSSGDITKDQVKKINGKYYVFGETGVMKTGVVLWCAAGASGNDNHYHYINKLDLDYAEGANVAKKGLLQTDSNKYIKVDPEGQVLGARYDEYKSANGTLSPKSWRPNGIAIGDVIKLHLFGDDGARKTGTNNVEFADDTFTLYTNASNGDKGSGSFSKKYYSLGIQLKASPDIRYGIYTLATYNDTEYIGPVNDTTVVSGNVSNTLAGPMAAQSKDGRDTANWRYNLYNNHYEVLTTSGARQKGADGAKKDADGNYWLVQKGTNRLKGIWSVNTHSKKSFGRGFATRTVLNAGVIATVNCTYADLVRVNLAVPGNPGSYTEASDITSATWTSYVNRNSNGTETIYFELNSAANYAAYQSDYRDGSNKWIPMGLLDNSNKTVVADNTYSGTEYATAHGYDVVPNNDYFLNCYWYSPNEPDVINP